MDDFLNARRVATFAMKIFGLFIAVRGLESLIRGIEFTIQVGVNALVSAGVVSSLVVIGLGGAIWTLADRLAARALSESHGQHEQEDASRAGTAVGLSPLEIYTIAFTIVGVYLISQSVVYFAAAAGQWILSGDTAGRLESVSIDFAGEARRQFVSAWAYLVAGLPLALRARAIGAFIHGRARRTRGADPSQAAHIPED